MQTIGKALLLSSSAFLMQTAELLVPSTWLPSPLSIDHQRVSSVSSRFEQQMAEEELGKLEEAEAKKKRDEESAKYKANPMAQLEEGVTGTS